MKRMNTNRTLSATLTLAGLLVQSLWQPATAATVYTNEASFVTAMHGAPFFLNDFADLAPYYDRTRVPLQYSGSNISYTVS